MLKRDKDGNYHIQLWRVAVLYITMVVLTSVSIFYSYHTNLQSDRKFCEIVMNINDAYEASEEPRTELGKKLRKNYADLERSLNCDREKHESR